MLFFISFFVIQFNSNRLLAIINNYGHYNKDMKGNVDWNYSVVRKLHLGTFLSVQNGPVLAAPCLLSLISWQRIIQKLYSLQNNSHCVLAYGRKFTSA